MNNPARAQTNPEAAIREVESSARRYETPCGTGRMIWRKWGAGHPVLLLHGGSGSWLHWLTIIPVLAQRRSVWVPDMPGFGDSDLPPQPYTRDAYAAVVQSGLQSLLSDTVRLDVAGFSFGGSVAARLARRLDGRFHHMILSGINFLPPSGLRRKPVSLRRIEDPTERTKGLKHNLQAMMIAHERNIDDLALHLYDLDTARRRAPRVPFSGFTGVRDDLPGARAQGPLAVISGADDQVIGHGSQAQAEALRLLRPDAQYQALEGAGHWVMYEAAELYNEALLASLEGA
jgi:2-hydroxy-6-oxonona-2,4-dienedioate hydrolase